MKALGVTRQTHAPLAKVQIATGFKSHNSSINCKRFQGKPCTWGSHWQFHCFLVTNEKRMDTEQEFLIPRNLEVFLSYSTFNLGKLLATTKV